MSTYTRLMVVQASDSEAAQQIQRDFRQTARHLHEEPGYQHSEVLAEDGAWLVILLTLWNGQEQAALFSSSNIYRLLLAAIETRIVGSPVVRIFKRCTGGTE
jgi:heme-degrading monooxygenase HmoA